MSVLLLASQLAFAEPDEAAQADEAVVAVEADPMVQARIEAVEARIEALETEIAGLHRRSSAGGEVISRTGPVVIEAGSAVEKVVGFGGPVDIYGEVMGDAVSMGGDVRVHDGGIVQGDAVSFGGQVEIESGGAVHGDRVAFDGMDNATGSMAMAMNGAVTPFFHSLARRIAILLSFAGAGVLVVGVWPRQVARVSRAMSERMFWYGIAGFILSLALLVGAGMFGITVVGLPLSLVLVVVLAVAWLLGVVALCTALGDRFPFASKQGRWAAFLAGAGLLAIVSLIPYIGPVMLLVLGAPAVGAALLTRLGGRGELD